MYSGWKLASLNCFASSVVFHNLKFRKLTCTIEGLSEQLEKEIKDSEHDGTSLENLLLELSEKDKHIYTLEISATEISKELENLKSKNNILDEASKISEKYELSKIENKVCLARLNKRNPTQHYCGTKKEVDMLVVLRAQTSLVNTNQLNMPK